MMLKHTTLQSYSFNLWIRLKLSVKKNPGEDGINYSFSPYDPSYLNI